MFNVWKILTKREYRNLKIVGKSKPCQLPCSQGFGRANKQEKHRRYIMPFCIKCGTEVTETAKFCQKCGNALQASQSSSGASTAAPATAPVAPAAKSSTAQAARAGNPSLWDYYVIVLKDYANFKGRARRKEYWGFVLFNFIITIALSIFVGVANKAETLATALYYLYGLGILIPSLAVLIRRLHDIGKSGWWWLLVFTIVGVVPVLIWLCTDSEYVENEYGPDPKSQYKQGNP